VAHEPIYAPQEDISGALESMCHRSLEVLWRIFQSMRHRRLVGPAGRGVMIQVLWRIFPHAPQNMEGVPPRNLIHSSYVAHVLICATDVFHFCGAYPSMRHRTWGWAPQRESYSPTSVAHMVEMRHRSFSICGAFPPYAPQMRASRSMLKR
jgi:hypothetical protein